MSDKLIQGIAWVGGDHIHAPQIIEQPHWTDPLDPIDNSRWVMAGVDPTFRQENAFKNMGYAFIVAGSNFGGGGKSIEHIVNGLKGAGIKAVLADSFARLQFRNAVNNGLPFMVTKGVRSIVATGDKLEVNLATGYVRNLSNGKVIQGSPIPEFVVEIDTYGGILPYIRAKIADGTFLIQE
jgi:3-isopropylmalate/(R)-2-methylmalate dehydratase small subunit